MKRKINRIPLKIRVLRFALFASLVFTFSMQKADAQDSLTANLIHQYCLNGNAINTTGTFLNTLNINGKYFDSKKMILTSQ